METVNLLKENFVCVAVDARTKSFKDSDAEFMKATDCVAITANGRGVFVTAGGKRLGEFILKSLSKLSLSSTKNGLKAWNALPEEERKPGAVKIGDRGELDPRRVAQQLPKNALIVRSYNRQFEYEDGGKLRYTKPGDYPEKSEGARQPDRMREAAEDAMWITSDECRSFLFDDPKKGDTRPAPSGFSWRLFRYHLDPERGLGEGVTFGNVKPDSGNIVLTVEQVTPKEVRLRLQGTAKLSQNRKDDKGTSYEPAFLGYLSYDPASKAITKFRMVALGDVTNTPRGVRPGPHPLGIAFELVTNPTPADYLLPRGFRDRPAAYFAEPSKAK